MEKRWAILFEMEFQIVKTIKKRNVGGKWRAKIKDQSQRMKSQKTSIKAAVVPFMAPLSRLLYLLSKWTSCRCSTTFSVFVDLLCCETHFLFDHDSVRPLH